MIFSLKDCKGKVFIERQIPIWKDKYLSESNI